MMNKIQVTAQQRANALEALNVMWPSVPEANVFPTLKCWRDTVSGIQPDCGTVACFGGWCEWWPEFRRQMGLRPAVGGAGWTEVAGLFGNPDNFYVDRLLNPRGGHSADFGFEGTDHELVTNRLNWLIENSEVTA